MGTKNRNRRIADFFLLYHYPFRVLFSTYYTKLSLVVVKKTRQHKQQRQHFYLIPKVLSKVVLRCRLKNDNIDNKDNNSFLFQKCCPKLSFVVVKKNHLFMKIFIFVSENIKMFCLGNISLSLKSTIRFFQKESHLFNVLRNEMVD